MSEREQENTEAFNKLLDEKEHMDTADMKRYRYYEDLYNNQYRWYTHKQNDGKFKAVIVNAKIKHGWLYYTTKKSRSFVRRRTAKSWCLKYYMKASEHQKIVIHKRAERKQARLDAKPKLTKNDKSRVYNEEKITHYEKLQAKCDTKIKTLTTRKKTYQKRIRYHKKRIEVLTKKEMVI